MRVKTLMEIRKLVKSFGQNTVLRGVDLTVNKGDVVAILGPSGSGKTTLLRCINFLERADSGTMIFDGQAYDLGRMHRDQIAAIRKKTAFVFQSYNLFANKTAIDNVTLGLTSARGMEKSKARKIGMDMLDKVGLADRAGYYPIQLSGGQQQRVAIARALVKRPGVLLLDEPLSNLDARLRLQTREEIRRIQKETGITTIFVTHDQEEAMSITDLIVVMERGIIRQIGKPQDVYDDPENLFVAKFLGTPAINVFSARIRDGGLYIGSERITEAPAGTPDKEVTAAIRPEGLVPDPAGTLTADVSALEVMGRDCSIVFTHPASESAALRAIVGSELLPPAGERKVRFSVKPAKIFIFDEKGDRIRPGEIS